jgi:hypothetical protein
MTMTPNTPNPASPPPAAGIPAASGDAFEELKKLVAAAEEDYQKAIGGNKAAGTRVRKSMQDIKAQAQAIRVRVLETRSTTP